MGNNRRKMVALAQQPKRVSRSRANSFVFYEGPAGGSSDWVHNPTALPVRARRRDLRRRPHGLAGLVPAARVLVRLHHSNCGRFGSHGAHQPQEPTMRTLAFALLAAPPSRATGPRSIAPAGARTASAWPAVPRISP
jgi:hypothetical protein